MSQGRYLSTGSYEHLQGEPHITEAETVVDVEAMTADEQDDVADEALQDGDETAE